MSEIDNENQKRELFDFCKKSCCHAEDSFFFPSLFFYRNLNQETVEIEAKFPNGTSQDNWPVTSTSSSSSKPLWPSPSYPQLRGNVLPRFLSFSMTQFPTPSNNEVFPTIGETQNYLSQFAKPLQDKIKCNIEVVGIYELPPSSPSDGNSGGWKVIIRDWNEGSNGKRKIEYWDSIVIASGWTEKEYYPKAKGFEKAKKLNKVHHAKWYRNPDLYKDKKVIVVGNGNSANDIAAHLASLKNKDDRDFQPVYRSIKSEASPLFVSLEDERIQDVAEIKEYHDENGQLNVELINGEVLKGIDFVIFGTGYLLGDYPFVHLLNRTPNEKEIEEFGLSNTNSKTSQVESDDWNPPTSESNLYSSVISTSEFPNRIPDLYHQCLHSRNPTLSFVGLIISSTPFVSSDLISWFIRSIYDSTLSLPSDPKFRSEYEKQRLELLEERKEKSKPLSESLKKEWESSIKNIKRAAAPKAVPFSLHYHVLGGGEENDETEYSKNLRDRLIETKEKKWLDEFLDPWNDEREKDRMGMYGLKYQSLLKRRQNEKK